MERSTDLRQEPVAIECTHLLYMSAPHNTIIIHAPSVGLVSFKTSLGVTDPVIFVPYRHFTIVSFEKRRLVQKMYEDSRDEILTS